MKLENYNIRFIKIADLKEYYSLLKKNEKGLEDIFTATVSTTHARNWQNF